MNWFAQCLAGLLFIQMLLIPLEVLIGMPLHDHFLGYTRLSGRAVGTMVMPNSLGVFAVIALGFIYTFSKSRYHFRSLSIITFFIVLFSGSATGFVCLFIMASVVVLKKIVFKKTIVYTGIIILFLVFLILLPALVGRMAVYSSLQARISEFNHLISHFSKKEILFGKAIGLGTNVGYQIKREQGTPELIRSVAADSTPAALLAQTGMVGTILFYLILFSMALQNPRIRLMCLLIFLVSLTVKVNELFPVNFILGLIMAHTFFHYREQTAQTPDHV